MFKTIGVLHQISKFRNTTTLTEWQESSLVTGRTGQEKQKASLKNVWPLEEIRKQKKRNWDKSRPYIWEAALIGTWDIKFWKNPNKWSL